MSTRISEELQRAVDRAFRDPLVFEAADAYLLARKQSLEAQAAESARAALFDQSKAPAALLALGRAQEVNLMLEIINRWKE